MTRQTTPGARFEARPPSPVTPMTGNTLLLLRALGLAAALLAALFAAGCAVSDFDYAEAARVTEVTRGSVLANLNLGSGLEDRILALDPNHISTKEVKEVLSHAPAPRIINIYGGLPTVYPQMESFSKFLIGMGYPENRIRNPRDGTYAYSPYKSAEELAGIAAWYYEKEGMQPMIVGHSQGGMQAIKVLYELSGALSGHLHQWDPITESQGDDYVVDPVTGLRRPVVGLRLSFVTGVGSGGPTRLLPNQWVMAGKLRRIPNTVEEFTGFYMHGDILGGDDLGFGSGNKYVSIGSAKVRTVLLPFGYDHVFVPFTSHLARHAETRDWINDYLQTDEPVLEHEFNVPSANILWAADVWTSVKRHWCIELQRLIRAKRMMRNGA